MAIGSVTPQQAAATARPHLTLQRGPATDKSAPVHKEACPNADEEEENVYKGNAEVCSCNKENEPSRREEEEEAYSFHGRLAPHE